ncbi:ankyrin repeat-containing domain protein [Baffinella frigidus]|nr:ankyrin repeat-containing domain protein [Cryptophyta sp. CCMP2293]
MALHHAAKMDNLAPVEMLVECGADVNAMTDDGSTPLCAALWRNAGDTVQYLIRHGADALLTGPNGMTTLHIAASRNSFLFRNLLALPGMDSSARDESGRTPLHIAASYGHDTVVRTLCHSGADLSLIEVDGMTAEQMAVYAGEPEIAAIIQTEARRRIQCQAFAMGHHERLGEASRVRSLDPELLCMIGKMLDGAL